jgi:hypothetical protein
MTVEFTTEKCLLDWISSELGGGGGGEMRVHQRFSMVRCPLHYL